MLVHSKMVFPLTSIGDLFERRAYWFIFNATKVFSIPTKAEQTENGEHFANV